MLLSRNRQNKPVRSVPYNDSLFQKDLLRIGDWHIFISTNVCSANSDVYISAHGFVYFPQSALQKTTLQHSRNNKRVLHRLLVFGNRFDQFQQSTKIHWLQHRLRICLHRITHLHSSFTGILSVLPISLPLKERRGN